MSDTTIESLQVDIQSNSTSAVSGIEALSNSLSKLKSSIKGGVGLSTVAKQIEGLNTALSSVDGSSADKISRLADSLAKLSSLGSLKISSSVGNQLKAIGVASGTISSDGLSNIEKLGTALAPLAMMGKASGLTSSINALKKLPEVAAGLKGIDWTTLTSELNQLNTALEPLADNLNKVSSAASKLPSNISKSTTAVTRLSSSGGRAKETYVDLWAKMRTGLAVAKRAASAISGWVAESNKYVEDINLFTASMGEYAKSAQEYAEKVGDLMGIDPADWMRNQGVFNTIIEGFGVASDKAALMSKNLTQLGYDISSFYNISVEDAMAKLQSGIAGELEPLRRIGYDLSVARLQQDAYNLGIQKSVQSMTQAEKSQLRYYEILTQVKTVQGDMARTLNSPANQIRILRAEVTQLARALGDVFIPILNAVIPYLIAFAKALRLVAQTIANFVGFKLPEVDYSGLEKTTGGIADNIGDANTGLGKANKNAKKLKNNLLGIDELNILSDNDAGTGSGNGSGIGGGADLGIDLPQYDFLDGLISSKTESIIDEIKRAIGEIMAILSGALLAIGAILTFSGANIPLGIALMAAGAIGLATALGLNWNLVGNDLKTVLSTITAFLGGFLLVLGAVLLFSGANPPLGLALMALGAASLATSIALNPGWISDQMKDILSGIEMVLGGFLFAVGAVLAFSGVAPGVGLALMVAGAATFAAGAALNWDSLTSDVKKAVGMVQLVVSGMLLGLGAVLAFSGIDIPLGIALIAVGAVGLASAAALNWNLVSGKLKDVCTAISLIVGAAALAIGAVMTFSGGNIPLGIALMAAGAVGVVSAIAVNWNSVTGPLSTTISKILTIVGVASVAIGTILLLTGAAAGVGIAMIIAGIGSTVAGVALNWNAITGPLQKTVGKILTIVGAASLAIGIILCLTGVGIPIGIGLILAGVASLGTAVAINWDWLPDKVKEVAGNISKGFQNGIKDLGTFLKELPGKIFDWFVGGIKDLFGIHSPSTVMADIGGNIVQGLVNGIKSFGDLMGDIGTWVKDNVLTPIGNAVKNSPPVQFAIEVANKASEWWSDVKTWWADASKDGVTLDTFVQLIKKGWDTVTKWIGNIPIIKQFVSLVKQGWQNVKNWIGNIPVLNQGIQLIKHLWTTIKNWIGTIPTLDQKIQLVKHLWTTVKNWIGNIPTLSQFIGLAKSGWTTVKNWIGNLPVIGQAISLLKSGWTTISAFIGTAASVGISLFKSGWSTIASFVGTKVRVGIELFKSGWSALKSFFGLSSGGYNTGHGFKLFEKGGFVDGKHYHGWGIPTYASGSMPTHGSMFVAGENGAEMVGHIGGQTEVLNRSQIYVVMKSAVISGMALFVPYLNTINSTTAASANAIVRSVIAGAQYMVDNQSVPNAYDPSRVLAQAVTEDAGAKTTEDYSYDGFTKALNEFYTANMAVTMKSIADDTKRQADKTEQTIVRVGNKTITDAVTEQQQANGYSFT